VKKKIFLYDFVLAGKHTGTAMDEDGNHLANATGVNKEEVKENLLKKDYPEGYEIEWVENPKNHAGIKEAVHKNNTNPNAKRIVEIEVPKNLKGTPIADLFQSIAKKISN